MRSFSLLPILIFLSLSAFSQKASSDDTLKIKKVKTKYLTLGAGFHASKFRDFATSPLFYEGLGTAFSLGALRSDDSVESEFVFQNLNGIHGVYVGNESAVSTFNQSILSYSYMLSFRKLSNEKWNFKAGAMLNALLNVRQNESLFNNSFGLESVNTLFVSAKAKRDISRSKMVVKKLLFLKIKLKPKKRDVSFRFNVGVVNNNLRNGYAYLNQSWIISDDSQVLNGYKYAFFSGARLTSEWNYTRHLTNGNAIRFAFNTDVYTTGNQLDKFEAAHYTLKFILLFRTK